MLFDNKHVISIVNYLLYKLFYLYRRRDEDYDGLYGLGLWGEGENPQLQLTGGFSNLQFICFCTLSVISHVSPKLFL